jgi:hypothetical protein
MVPELLLSVILRNHQIPQPSVHGHQALSAYLFCSDVVLLVRSSLTILASD